MEHLTWEGVKIAYRKEGTGPGLLFIHDWNTSSIPFQRVNLPVLRRNFQVLVFDLPGYGNSQRKPDLEIADLSSLVITLADHAGWDRFTLMGFCLGGILAMDTALRFPGRVERTVILEPLFHFPWILNLLLWKGIGGALLDFFSGTGRGQRWFLRFMTYRSPQARIRLSRVFHGSRGGTSYQYLQLLKDYGKQNHWKRIAGYKNPGLVLIGGRTWGKIKTAGRQLVQVCPQVQHVTLLNSGHFLLSENPGTVHRAVEKFLL